MDPWIPVTICIFIILLFSYIWCSQRESNQTTEKITDEQYLSMLSNDIVQVSFRKLYEVFPFDVSDNRYVAIRKLEHVYCLHVNIIRQELNSRPNNKHISARMVGAVKELEECLDEIEDKMMQYRHVEAPDFQEFKHMANDIQSWFDDLRRLHQGQLRYKLNYH
jgi:hypothetical protein